MKKASIQIKQALDLDDPQSKLLLTLGAANVAVMLLTMPFTAALIDSILQQMVNLLFMLYVLSCFRNGECNLLALVISMMAIALLFSEVVLRVLHF